MKKRFFKKVKCSKCKREIYRITNNPQHLCSDCRARNMKGGFDYEQDKIR